MEGIPVYLVYILVFMSGTVVGSFISCYVWRAHNNISLIIGRSRCVHCGRQLKWWENIPILSFLILGGKCRVCNKKIPLHYLLIEFFTGVLFVFIYWTDFQHFQTGAWSLARDLFFLACLIVIFIGDLLYETIWPALVWVGAAIGFLLNVIIDSVSIEMMAVGFVVGCLFFLIQYIISRGRWIGGGDVRLGALMGVWLGFPNVLVAIMLAYLLGALISIFLLIFRKKSWSAALPLGSFLAVATIFALNHGSQVVEWFAGLL